jgi:hypothetical protein
MVWPFVVTLIHPQAPSSGLHPSPLLLLPPLRIPTLQSPMNASSVNVVSPSDNNLRAKGATVLSLSLTALKNLQLINVW